MSYSLYYVPYVFCIRDSVITTCFGTGYMLEGDPDKRPTVWQVGEVVARIRGCSNPLPNVFVRINCIPNHLV